MRRRLFYWELAGFAFTGALGTALHFVYDWSGQNPAAAVFSAVNDSTWEHMKLLFVPVFLLTVIQVGALGREFPHLLWSRTLSILAGLALIPILFYTYTGVLGFHVTWADIAVFFLADGGLFALDGWLLRRGRHLRDGEWEKVFTEKPEVLTREEKKEWLAKNTDVSLGSDAFFPFGDNIERAHKSGVGYIAQPGGSIRDDNVIETCNKYGIAMAFTGIRLFHH